MILSPGLNTQISYCIYISWVEKIQYPSRENNQK